jgi:hypothetical protein
MPASILRERMRVTLPILASTALMGLSALVIPDSSGAQTIVGGSSLLSSADANQLATWLGQGPITLTRIFDHVTGDGKTDTDFHTAADGQGATFTVLSAGASSGSNWVVIGGYNPVSWFNTSNYTYTPNLSDRTAFLFNLTTNTKIDQSTGPLGIYQTFNAAGYGPAFGNGFDIGVGPSLNSGYAYQYSYGTGGPSGTNIFGSTGNTNTSYREMEVFALAPDLSVPEPGVAVLGVGAGTLGMMLVRRNRASRRQR